MTGIDDRWDKTSAPALGAAWLAFVAGLVFGGEVDDLASLSVAALAGAALVVLGFGAAWRCRTLTRRVNADRARLALLSLAAGTLLGLANLAANVAIAAAHPRIQALLAARMTRLQPLDGIVAAPLVEEVLVRLFLMSVMAWVVFRLTRRSGPAFLVALVGSSFIFATLHLGRPFPDDPALADYYRAALLLKYTLAGLPLGWIFWRWGLPYAMLCHAATNAAHLVLQRHFF
jgi:membrane protease YdiL (CAAX protease family)